MMKQILIVFFMILMIKGGAHACVGKALFIGALDTVHDRILAEMLSVLINERTGTTVNVKFFNNSKELYSAIEQREIGIIIENTERGMDITGIAKAENVEKTYPILKDEFRKRYNLICLQPSGFASTGAAGRRILYLPAITVEVMNNFPALPRVINKLAGIMNDDEYGRVIKSFDAGEKPRKAARDFLKFKKFI